MTGLLDRLRQRWKHRGSVSAPTTTTALPHAEHYQESAEDKFRRQRGYSMATAPLEATKEIAAHNAAIEAEYQAEIERRKAAYARGEYQPRFLYTMEDGTQQVAWDLELSSRTPDRRLVVTTDPGTPTVEPVTLPTQDEVDASRLETSVGRMIGLRLVNEAAGRPTRVKDLVGGTETILRATGGNVRLAEQVKKNALDLYGVSSLDDVIPDPANQ